MQITDLADLAQNAEDDHGRSTLVVAKDVATGKIYDIKGITPERHDDGDGSTTLWLDLEEH